MSNPKNKVQAPHHQIVSVEEAKRAIEADRAIGTNDIISHALRHLDPRVAAPMAHALSYLLRIGAKDDEQMEIEKSIWWLMDAHNRLSDIREKDREYAPWAYTGKLKDREKIQEVAYDHAYENFRESQEIEIKPLPPTVEISNGFDNDEWEVVEDPFDDKDHLDISKFSAGEVICFNCKNERLKPFTPYEIKDTGYESDLCIEPDDDTYYYFIQGQMKDTVDGKPVTLYRRIDSKATKWVEVTDALTTWKGCENCLNPAVLSKGDIVKFSGIEEASVTDNDIEYEVTEFKGDMFKVVLDNGTAWGFVGENVQVFKKVEV